MLKEIAPPHEFFLNDPKLSLLALHDSDLASLHKNKKLVERPNSTWYMTGNIGVIRMEPQNEEEVSVHLYIRSDLHGQGLLKYATIDIVNYLLENTHYSVMVVPIPKSCKHVIRHMKPLGFKKTSTIRKGISWRGEQVDLMVYKREIRVWQ